LDIGAGEVENWTEACRRSVGLDEDMQERMGLWVLLSSEEGACLGVVKED
jgi:hypothetical protein